MSGSRLVTTLALVAGLAAFAGGTAKAATAGSCGLFTAAHKQWIVVAKGVSCATATGVVQQLGARTAAVHPGANVTVPSPLRGFTCVVASNGHPAGSCATPGAAKSIVWIIAA
jgi:hypothetical protein